MTQFLYSLLSIAVICGGVDVAPYLQVDFTTCSEYDGLGVQSLDVVVDNTGGIVMIDTIPKVSVYGGKLETVVSMMMGPREIVLFREECDICDCIECPLIMGQNQTLELDIPFLNHMPKCPMMPLKVEMTAYNELGGVITCLEFNLNGEK